MAALILVLIHSAAHAFKLPDTGQTKCYDVSGGVIPCDNTGQDGDYIINPMSYTDNGNGTVTDNNTGLLWQKCSVGQDSTTCSGTASTRTWDQATSACTVLNLGGHQTGWRLPTKTELINIVDYSTWYPAINDTYFPNTVPTGYYWSSTTPATASAYAFLVSSNNGWVGQMAKSNDSSVYPSHVRCVWGAQTGLSFTNNGNATVTDNNTGLMWQKCEAGENNEQNTCSGNASHTDWSSALSYCNDLVLPVNGYSDWRLPNVKELESLTDDSRTGSLVDPAYFPNEQSDGGWSSDTYAVINSTSFAWYVRLTSYISDSATTVNKTDPNRYIRCVRGGQTGLSSNFLRLMRGSTPVNTYATFHDAYAAAADGDVIQAQAVVLPVEQVTLSSASSEAVAVDGGYDGVFGSVTGMTTLSGSLTIGGGTTLSIENLIIK